MKENRGVTFKTIALVAIIITILVVATVAYIYTRPLGGEEKSIPLGSFLDHTADGAAGKMHFG